MKTILKQPLFFFFLSLFVSCSTLVENNPKVENGSIRLDKHAIQNSVKLNGYWEFYWDEYLYPLDFNNEQIERDALVEIPGIWKNLVVDNRVLPGTGIATLRIRVDIPGQRYTNLGLHVGSIDTAYKLWINGREAGSSGKLGLNREEMLPGYDYVIYSVGPVEESFDIVIQISDFYTQTGGVWSELLLGPVDVVSRIQNFEFSFDLFIFGILFIMGIYHVFMFIFRHKEKSSLMFGLYCLIFSLRVALVNTRLIHVLSDENIWVFLYKLEYLTFYSAVPVFTILIYFLYRQIFDKRILKVIVGVAAAFCLALLFVPVTFVSYTATVYQIFTLLVGVYIIYVLIYGAKYSHEGARLFLFGMTLFFLTILVDILRSLLVWNIRHISPIGITILVVLQSIIMAKRFTNSFNKVENLTSDLFSTNMAYSRFVPHELLDLLNLQSINSVKLGSSIECEMTILFSDIRNFTEMSETMTPQENFNFLNSFYGKISPVIRSNGGFIDKYIGDGFMALFHNSPKDAVAAAVQMRHAIGRYNEERDRAGYRRIDIGIGIHSGSIILGTIGDEERMDGTVISDTVNLASRLEDLTKIGAPIIVSHTTLYSLDNILDYNFRFIGEMYVKGKQNRASVFEIYDGCPEEIVRRKNETKRDFELGITFLSSREYALAEKQFRLVLEKMPEDRVSKFYLERIKYKITMPFRFHESMIEID